MNKTETEAKPSAPADLEVIKTDELVSARHRRTMRAVQRRVISLIFLLLIWQVASFFLAANILPGPERVFAALWESLHAGDTYFQLFKTIERVIGGMVIAVVLGLVVGIVMGLSRRGEDLLDSWVLVGFTIPSIVYGIVCILWFGLTDTAAVIAIGVSGFPVIAINIWQGTKAIDYSLVNMGKAFHFSNASIMMRIIIPQLIPYVLAAFRYALGISWKIATVVELIGLSSGVGYQLNYWFGLFNMTQVLSWTLIFTITLLAIEYVILKPVEARLTRWRPVSEMQRGL